EDADLPFLAAEQERDEALRLVLEGIIGRAELLRRSVLVESDDEPHAVDVDPAHLRGRRRRRLLAELAAKLGVLEEELLDALDERVGARLEKPRELADERLVSLVPALRRLGRQSLEAPHAR